MKKLIAILLVLVTLATMSFAAFTDEKDITGTYSAAVQTMVEAGVINGFEDGTFRPKGTLTRAQAAKIITVLLEGEKADSVSAPAAGFVDVPAGSWAEKFVNYCAEKGIVAGVGNGKFDPNGELKGAQWAKMLLVAYGHDAAELTGDKWFSNTQKAIKEKGLGTNAHISDSVTTREKACQLAYNFYLEYTLLAAVPYEETTVSFANGKNMRLLGRAEATADGVITNFPGDGVEFEIECGGIMELTVKAEYAGNYRLIVDGKPMDTRPSHPTGTPKALPLGEFVEPGKHTIRIIQDNDMSSSGYVNTLQTLTLRADEKTMKATEAKKLYVEFVGDSITAGVGVFTDGNNLQGNSAYYGYSYQTAMNLDADYALIAKGGLALAKLSSSTPKVFGKELYLAHNAYKDETRNATFKNADVVVLALCTNDARNNEEQFVQKLNELVDTVKAKNPKAKVVCICNLMNDKYIDEIMAVNDPAKGVYSLKLVQNRKGGANHPLYTACAENAKTLADFIKTIL